jgi:hypothetical protein
MDQRRTKTLEPEIIRAFSLLDPVEKRRQLHELVSGIQKIKVKHVLAGHIKLSEYKTKMPDGNRKNDTKKRPHGHRSPRFGVPLFSPPLRISWGGKPPGSVRKNP